MLERPHPERLSDIITRGDGDAATRPQGLRATAIETELIRHAAIGEFGE
jgi:hypothetical protein